MAWITDADPTSSLRSLTALWAALTLAGTIAVALAWSTTRRWARKMRGGQPSSPAPRVTAPDAWEEAGRRARPIDDPDVPTAGTPRDDT